ncbi:MAG: DUF116 domain-containing protein [Sulfuricella sp.]|nr:DUF116 domain-containing protein [Sulfuricella sp.]
MQDKPTDNLLLDTGLQSGGWNARFDHAWLELHAVGERPGLLRFYRSTPSVTLGRHQAPEHEIRADYCRQKNIEIVRRASGGGALYVDENQLGFSLIASRPAAWQGFGLGQMLAAFCAAIADGLSRLGMTAAFKAPNDLEIEGRKLASAFIAIEGDAILLHATLLCDVDIQTLLEALRAPTEKLTVTGLESARQRLATVREVLGEIPPDAVLKQALREGLAGVFGRRDFGADFIPSPTADLAVLPLPRAGEGRGEGLSGMEMVVESDDPHPNPSPCTRKECPRRVPAAAQRPRRDGRGAYEPTTPDIGPTPLEALHKTPGGVLRARLRLDASGQSIDRIRFAGDLHVHPADLLERLQQTLAGMPLEQAEAAVSAFFDQHPGDLLGFSADDIRHVLRLAIDKLAQQELMGLSARQANQLMVAGGESAEAVLARASVMLLPYCAKPAWCKWRSQDDCGECGKCAVGDAYRMARERNMQVTTITHYEHLTSTLGTMKADGVEAYVGACCSQFFVKRHRAFEQAGMNAVLMDISGANCYELKQEEAAYAGQFQAEAELDADLLERVMRRVPALSDGQPQEQFHSTKLWQNRRPIS